MNPTKPEDKLQNKQCAGRGCEHRGISFLNIRFIHRKGFFCDNCASDLFRLGLATFAEDAVV